MSDLLARGSSGRTRYSGLAVWRKWLLVACLALPAALPAADVSDEERLDGLRKLIESVEEADAIPGPEAVALLVAAADELRAAAAASGTSESDVAQIRRLLDRVSALLLLPEAENLKLALERLESREAPITAEDLASLGPVALELRERVREIAKSQDPQNPGKPRGMTAAHEVLRRFATIDFGLAAAALDAEAERRESEAPPPTTAELEPIEADARVLAQRLEQVDADVAGVPEKTAQQVRAAVERVATLKLIPTVEGLRPFVDEMESRKTALSEEDLRRVAESAEDLAARIEEARSGTLDQYDPKAPPAAARARVMLRRLISLELQPQVDAGNQWLAQQEGRDRAPTEEELAEARPAAAEVRELLQGFEDRLRSGSKEDQPDLVQQARQMLWRFALLDLQASVAEMDPLVVELENQKKSPTEQQLAELRRMAEGMQPKLREARGKDEAEFPDEERTEGIPTTVTEARDLMRRAGARQPKTLAAPEEGRDAPVTQPFLKKFRFYGSLRVRTFFTKDGFSSVDDETSRVGIQGGLNPTQKIELYGRFEVGLNPFSFVDELEDLGKDTSTLDRARELFPIRLAYVGIQAPPGYFALGKLWSTYWNVAVFSDQLPVYTGVTNGTFNIGDGSASGTGRPEGVVQYSNETGSFTYSGQFQIRNVTDNDQPLANTFGGSTIYSRKDGIDLGLAFNVVRDGVEQPEPDEPKSGDQAYLVGARTKDDKRYVGATVSYTANHNRDDQGRYFRGVGFEAYADYLIIEKLRLRAVIDGLFPTSGHEGSYRLSHLVFGASYDVLERLRVFLLPRLSFSKNSDGSNRGDYSVALLVLFNF